jgi:hypothetical protein
MAYRDFSLARVKKDFGLTLDESRNLFAGSNKYVVKFNYSN